MKKELTTKEVLNKATKKWLDETELKQNPLDVPASRNNGAEFDPEADAKKFAERLPDRELCG